MSASLLGELRGRGVTFTVDGGHLRWRAPRGVMTPEDLTSLAKHKHEIIAILRGEAAHAKDSPVSHEEVRVRVEAFTGQVGPDGAFPAFFVLPQAPSKPETGMCRSCGVFPILRDGSAVEAHCAPCIEASWSAVEEALRLRRSAAEGREST